MGLFFRVARVCVFWARRLASVIRRGPGLPLDATGLELNRALHIEWCGVQTSPRFLGPYARGEPQQN